MIYSYSITDQTLASNTNLVYNVDVVKTGSTVTHTPGTATFILNKPGYYYVTVTASGSTSATGTDPITIALYNGVTPISGAESSALGGDIVNLTINAIIPVRPSCCAIDNTVNLRVFNTGVETTYSNTTITITKIA